MRVLLASAPHADTFGYSMPPPGLLRLGGALRALTGVAVELEDLAFRLAAGDLAGDDELPASAATWLLRKGAPDVLGLSTMGATLPAALAIAARVKRAAPATRVLLGGPGTTGIDVALIERFDAIDAVVRGEGEETLPALLFRLGSDAAPEVPGVTWRDGRGAVRREPDRLPLADLGALPDYAFDLLPPMARYKEITGEEEGLVPIDSGRGCVYDCSFCTIGRFWGRRSRPVPAARVAREVRALRGVEGAKRAYLCHDIFGADRTQALELCDALAEVGMPWECRARVDHLDDELIERMGAAGCYRVLLGVESADPHVRDAHAKRMAHDTDVVHAVERLGAAGITPILSFIVGLPGEDEAALERTLALALDASLARGCNLSFHLVNPQPGCGLGETHGEASRPLEGVPPDMALGAGRSAEERALIAAHPDLFSTFAVLTGEPGGAARLRALHRLAGTLPEVLMSRPRAFAWARRRLGLSVSELHARVDERDADAAEAVARFDAFARGLGDAVLDDLLAWERAIERAEEADPGSAAQIVRARFALDRAARGLRSAAPDAGELSPAPTCFAVRRGERGVRTVRVSPDVARLCEAPADALGADEAAWLAAQGLRGITTEPDTVSPTSA